MFTATTIMVILCLLLIPRHQSLLVSSYQHSLRQRSAISSLYTYRALQRLSLKNARATSSHNLNQRLHSSKASSPAEMSEQLRSLQASMVMDEKTRLMMDALRGKNLNDDDRQGQGIDMKVVEMASSSDATDVLPLVYDPVKLQKYFDRRPTAVATRVWQIFSTSFGYVFDLATDYLTGNTKDIEVRRAAELRNTIVSLGPFFIKLGQALSIRPDILSPRAMVELQQLCDKVPCFDNKLAMRTIEEELGRPVSEVYKEMSPDPVAAASLGQVYRAKLVSTGDEVAVKVQRPFVLETVSLDLHLVRQIGLFIRKFPSISNRLDIVSLLDEFANNFYQELDYTLECQNGIRIMKDMAKLPRVVIPKPYPDYCTRRVHTAQWIDGEKLSQSQANDVGALVNLGVITYLTQLLDTGFFHADPHPGNMLRTPDGKLVILDFGLMTKITDDQKFGMIEAIAHLIHRDYEQIGKDFVNLDFIPRGVDTAPIVPALARVFDAALAGGGAKSINFQELAADLAEITFKFPFRIPPYFALIIRAISVLEGIALVGNPEFAIVDEAYPFISKRLLTDRSPRAREAFRYMIYGQSDVLDVDRMIDMLQAFEKFMRVKDEGDGTSYKRQGKRGNVYVGKAGDALGTRTLLSSSPSSGASLSAPNQQLPEQEREPDAELLMMRRKKANAREALRLFFAEEGDVLREFVLEEVSLGIDALSRDAVRELLQRLRLLPSPSSSSSSTAGRPGFLPAMMGYWSFVQTVSPELSPKERQTVDGLVKLVSFFLGQDMSSSASTAFSNSNSNSMNSNSRSSITRQIVNTVLVNVQDETLRQQVTSEYIPLLQEFAPKMQEFGGLLLRKLIWKASSRVLNATLDVLFGPDPDLVNTGSSASNKKTPSAAAAAAAVASVDEKRYIGET